MEHKLTIVDTLIKEQNSIRNVYDTMTKSSCFMPIKRKFYLFIADFNGA